MLKVLESLALNLPAKDGRVEYAKVSLGELVMIRRYPRSVLFGLYTWMVKLAQCQSAIESCGAASQAHTYLLLPGNG